MSVWPTTASRAAVQVDWRTPECVQFYLMYLTDISPQESTYTVASKQRTFMEVPLGRTLQIRVVPYGTTQGQPASLVLKS